MKKPIFLVMLFIAVGLASCTKDQAELSTTPTSVPAKQRLSPMITAQFLRYVALSKQGDLQNARFESFPNVPIEYSKDLFDEVLAVYVPLKEEQGGGTLTEHEITVYPELEIFNDSEYGESITGESAGQFLTGAIDEIVDYVLALNLDGYKYVSYIYTSEYMRDDEVMIMKVHFGLVNNPEGENGTILCDPPSGMHTPNIGNTYYIIESMLNSENCNTNLRRRLRNDESYWPAHPSTYNIDLAPGFIWYLAYSGTPNGADIRYDHWSQYTPFYDSGNPYTIWFEDMPITVHSTTSINAGVLKEHISAMAYRASDSYFFPYLLNFYDPVGYLNVNSSTYFLGNDDKKVHHTVIYRHQKLKWVPIPDPDYWNISINVGLTPELNP